MITVVLWRIFGNFLNATKQFLKQRKDSHVGIIVLSGSGITFPPGQTVINSTNYTNMQQAAGWEEFIPGGGTGTRTWMDGGHASERRNAAMILIAPSEIPSSFLLLEDGTNKLLFEDSSGVLLLED